MKYLYQNWHNVIFMGFYESFLFNSDTEYNLNYDLKDDEDPKIYEIDFDKYTEEIARYTTKLLGEFIINDDNIIKNMKYKYLYSPKYYNFDTDRLNIEMDINLNNLKSYIKNNKYDFGLYLKDNFTSYDGFTSFISNNLYDFKAQYKYDKSRCINTMLEYYILNCIYGMKWAEIKQLDDLYNTPYHYELFDKNYECQYNNLIEVDEEENLVC